MEDLQGNQLSILVGIDGCGDTFERHCIIKYSLILYIRNYKNNYTRVRNEYANNNK